MRALRCKNLQLSIGLLVLFVLLFIGLFVPFFPLPNPLAQDLASEYGAPNAQHWLGQGENGVDLFSQVLWGARLSLFVGFTSVFLAAAVGVLLGSVAAYVGGFFESALMRLVDLLYAFPGIILVVALAVFLGPSVKNMVIAMALTSWIGYARLARALTLSLREREYIEAARALGLSTPRIVARHLWPNLLAPIIVQMTYGLCSAIMTESTLSFLGLGATSDTPSWGQMLNQGREVVTTATHLVLVPGLALIVCVLGLNLLGDGLRRRLDPKDMSLKGAN